MVRARAPFTVEHLDVEDLRDEEAAPLTSIRKPGTGTPAVLVGQDFLEPVLGPDDVGTGEPAVALIVEGHRALGQDGLSELIVVGTHCFGPCQWPRGAGFKSLTRDTSAIGITAKQPDVRAAG